MTLNHRLMVTGLLAGLGFSAFVVARHYSSAMIAYVVEEAILQKLPSGSDPLLARTRFRSLMASLPDPKTRTERLLSMSQYLEKIQVLEPQELNKLLTSQTTVQPSGNKSIGD